MEREGLSILRVIRQKLDAFAKMAILMEHTLGEVFKKKLEAALANPFNKRVSEAYIGHHV